MNIASFELLKISKEYLTLSSRIKCIYNNKIFLNKGNYTLKLTLNLDENNQGDLLSLNINDMPFYYINISVEKSISLNIEKDFNVVEDTAFLSIINESDDVIVISSIKIEIILKEDTILFSKNVANITPSINKASNIIPNIKGIIATKPNYKNEYITEEDNSFIIIYTDTMNTLSTSPYAVNNPSNYNLSINHNFYQLSLTTKIDDIYKKRWFRFSLPVNNIPPIPKFILNTELYTILVGYTLGPSIYYITNESGNILPLSTDGTIDTFVNKLDISKGNAIITTNNLIEYHLNSNIDDETIINNMFSSVYATDFEVMVSRGGVLEKYRPSKVLLKENSFTDLTLIFDYNVFTVNDDISIIVNPLNQRLRSLDIFGKPILCSNGCDVGIVKVTNKIPTSIVSISLLSLNYEYIDEFLFTIISIELLFEKSIKSTESGDFEIYYLDKYGVKHFFIVDTEKIVQSPNIDKTNTIQLKARIENKSKNNLIKSLFISTVNLPPFTYFNTYDTNNILVSQFANKPILI